MNFDSNRLGRCALVQSKEFTLVTGKYPVTANRRGTIEFAAPAGVQIGVLEIRIPIAHSFTTLPALAK